MVSKMTFINETEIETRENLIRYFTRYLGIELNKVNPAFRFIQIETPVMSTVLRQTTALGAYSASRELLNSKTGPKYRLPLVLWQHGKIFKPFKHQSYEISTLEYQVLFSKTTGVQYFPVIVRCCESMLRKQCGKIFKADEDVNGISIFTHDTDLELVYIHERMDFWGGKNIEISFNLDICTKVNIQHEFGKIRRSHPLDKK
jgi:hypothetical protein